MNIINFDRFRIGDINLFADVKSLSHSNRGFMVTAYEMQGKAKSPVTIVEVRKKEWQVAMFVLRYSDLEIPDFWKDAEILYRYEEGESNG